MLFKKKDKVTKKQIKDKKNIIIIIGILIVCIELLWLAYDINKTLNNSSSGSTNKIHNNGSSGRPSFDKPVIYLYPEEKTTVKVTLDYEGNLFADYPDYNYEIKGREVEAFPNGNLINISDNKEYSYLFWGMKTKRGNKLGNR